MIVVESLPTPVDSFVEELVTVVGLVVVAVVVVVVGAGGGG